MGENNFKNKGLTLGQRAADSLTKWAGSWYFILGLMFILVLWVCFNIYWLVKWHEKVFDPYPFILLNLILSCLAAMQAPIILMSQNREAERDREKSRRDYAVNRKAEKEIEKIIKSLRYIEGTLNNTKKKEK